MKILFATLIITIFATPSYAVVPSMWPFLQSLVSFLPQILLFILVGISVIFKFSTWKLIFAWFGRNIKTKIGIGVTIVFALAIMSLATYLFLYYTGNIALKSRKGQSDGVTMSEWTGFRGSDRRTGCLDGFPGPQDANEIWSFRESLDRAGFSSSPAISGNKVYVGSNNDVMYCFDASNGDVIWKFNAFYEVFSSPAIVDNKVYFGEGLHYTEDASFHCVNAETGDEIWSFSTTGQIESSPFAADGKVVFGAGKDGVYCLDAKTGQKLWQYSEVYVAGSPLIHDKKVYFGSGYGKNGIYCLDLADGSEIWTINTKYPAWGAPAVWDGKIYVGTGSGNFVFSSEEPSGNVMCLDTQTGSSVWDFELSDAILGAIAIDDGKIYFGSRNSNLYCIDATSGKELWNFTTDGAIVSSPAVTKENVYIGSSDGKMYCVDKEDGIAKWEFDTGESGSFNIDTGIIGSPSISKGKLYIGSMNFFFYCIGENEN